MPDGKFFFIRSQLTEFVLTIQDNVVAAGSAVCPYSSHGGDNQLWYEDRINGVIRSKAHDNLVLEITDDNLIVNDFEPDEHNQHWKLAGDHIEHTDDGKCLDIRGECEDEGASICAWEFGGGANQLFNFEYLPPKKCYIKSALNNYCIDIRDAEMNPGAKVHMWPCCDTENDNQCWWEDKYGHIKSCLNDFVFDNSEENKIRMEPYESELPGRAWVKNGKKISCKNEPSLVIEIRDGDDDKGAKVHSGEYSGESHQQWSFEYLE